MPKSAIELLSFIESDERPSVAWAKTILGELISGRGIDVIEPSFFLDKYNDSNYVPDFLEMEEWCKSKSKELKKEYHIDFENSENFNTKIPKKNWMKSLKNTKENLLT